MLVPIGESLWSVDTLLAQPGGVLLPGRCVIARLPDGALWMHSPVHLEDAVAAEIDALGEVRTIVAPNLLHYRFVADTARRWPRAAVLGAPGLARKCAGIPFTGVLEDGPHASVFTALHLNGIPGLEEVVFLHEPTGTLLVTDFVFNFAGATNWQTAAVLWMVGASQGVRQSRAVRFVFTGDKAALAESTRRMLDLPFDRLAPAHGEIVETGARSAVAATLPWLGIQV